MREADGAREISEWLAYQRIRGPLGPERADLAAGIIAAASVSPHLKKGARVAPVDFMPFSKRHRGRGMSNTQLKAVLSAAKAGFDKAR